MSEREKEIVRKLSNTIPKLDKEKQQYLLGVAEGMAITREAEKTLEPKKSNIEVSRVILRKWKKHLNIF